MKSSYEIERKLAAGPAAIWRVLTDARRLADGSFGILRIEGEIAPGARLKLWSEASPGRAFPLRVDVFEPERRLVWSGGMPLGLFRGVRSFILRPLDGFTQFSMREDYSGAMARMILPSIPDLTPSFAHFTDGLERAVTGASP